MFQSKEKRDTFLLVIMLVVTVLFILYQFFPSAKVEPNEKKEPKTEEKKVDKTQNILKILDNQQNPFSFLNSRIAIELNQIYIEISESNRPFEKFQSETIHSVLEKFISQKFSSGEVIQTQEMIQRALKLSFKNLSEFYLLDFPTQFEKTMRFNLFLSLFLIKLKDEEMIPYLLNCSENELRRMNNFEPYAWIDNEIVFDYQSIPFLFYFRIITGRNSAYPDSDYMRFFLDQIQKIRDLSDRKHLMEIRDQMEFYTEDGIFRIEWEEYDRLGPNDKKIFPNLTLKVCHFLNQKYLVFPDNINEENNFWISQLAASDVGKIELIKYILVSEDPLKNLYVKELIYAENSAQFIVVLQKYSSDKVSQIVDRIIDNYLNSFHKNFIQLDYTLETISPPLFKKELAGFGEYLQKRFGK